MNLETYIPGDGCECSAYNDSECGCGVDWTPKRIYELQEQLAAERRLADRLADALSDLWSRSDLARGAYESGEAALTAWEEARKL